LTVDVLTGNTRDDWQKRNRGVLCDEKSAALERNEELEKTK
jgi:hypothetical protein